MATSLAKAQNSRSSEIAPLSEDKLVVQTSRYLRLEFGIWCLPSFRHSWPPMKSMTGYGWGDAVQNGFKVTVELSSVNRKQSEISINLPRELEVLEAQIRDEINRRVARGRVTARV